MFSSITGIKIDSPCIFTLDQAQQKTKMEMRKEALTKYIKDLASSAKMKPETIAKIKIVPAAFLGFVEGSTFLKRDGTQIIETSIFLFLDLEKDFGIRTPRDLQEKLIEDSNWPEFFLNRSRELFGITPCPATDQDKEVIRCLLQKILENPEKALQSFRFVLLHELGHIHFAHNAISMFSVALSLVGGTVLIYVALTTLSLSVITAYPLLLFPLFLVAEGVAFIALKILFEKKIGRRHEIEADRFALSALRGVDAEKIREGAIHSFKTERELETSLEHYNHPSIFSQVVGAFYRMTDPHLSNKERIQMFEKFTIPSAAPFSLA